MNRYKNLVSFKPLRNNFKALGLAIVLVIAFAGVYSLAKSPQVHAACQPSGTTYGTDTLTSTVSSSGTYNLWVRMETPSTTANSIMLEVDGGNCYVMGGSATITPNTWTWVNYASGITGSPIQIPLSGGTTNNSHTFKFYGTSSGISVDRVLLLSDNSLCGSGGVPIGTGNNCTPAPSINLPFYMQAGGPGYDDTSDNIQWLPDQDYIIDNSFGESSGASQGGDGSICTTALVDTNCTTKSIAGTSAGQQQLYQSERWGAFHYDFPINNGTYTVVLKFAEINPGSGARVFNVTAQNGAQTLLTNFNIGSQVGNYTADDQSFTVNVTNGDLNLVFLPTSNTAKLSGIEILNTARPTIAITAPSSGATVNGNNVTLSSSPQAAAGVKSVEYEINSNVISTVTASPFSYSWDSTTVADGNYTLTAIVTDNSGATASAQEQITVLNHPCSTGPSAPTNLKETANTYTSITSTWSASVDSDGCNISGYHIYRNTAGSPFTHIGDTIGNSLTYTDTGLTSSNTYNYYVVAYDSGNNLSPASTTVAMTTAVDNEAPTAPTNLSATAPTSTTVNLKWDASIDLPNPGGTGVANYYIVRAVQGLPGQTIGQVPASQTTYSDMSALGGTTYNYYVYAEDVAGNASAPSNTVNIETPAPKDTTPPSVPQQVKAKAISGSEINLSWSPSTDNVAVAGYNVYLVGSTSPLNGSSLITSTNFGDSGLSPNTTYSYEVVAVDTSGNASGLSNVASTTTLGVNVTSAVQGVVTNKNTGEPLSAVFVSTPDKQRVHATTNAAGQYYLPVTPGKRYYYYVRGQFNGSARLNVPANTIITKNMALSR